MRARARDDDEETHELIVIMPNAAFSTQLIVRFGANKNEQNKKKSNL